MSNYLTMNKMKRFYILMMLLLAGIVVEAQTSVWDGSRELWTRGSGTEGDPYLIETAAQLAFLSYMVNKDFDTQGLYFRLTTDIDLNGSEDQPWIPIGLYNRGFDEDGCDRGNLNSTGFAPRSMFRGHFDGGGHSISNIYVDNEGSYAGLFGYANSWIEGDTVVIENVYVRNGYIKGINCGGIVGYGSMLTVSYCRNGADIEGDVVGGIVGGGHPKVCNCSNVGLLSGSNVGGIVGATQSRAVIIECFNQGNIIASRCGGGILGGSNNAIIENCYNTGDVSAMGESSPYYPAAGGLLAVSSWHFNAKNSYSVGEITGNHHVGCLIGFTSQPETTTFENCYYLNVCSGDEYGTPKSAEEMREEAFVDTLNQGNAVWGFDVNNINDGFPILVRTDLSVDSNEEQQLAVFPNPVKDVVSIEGRDVAEIQVYNILGVKVKSFTNTNRISVEGLPEGLYLLRIADKEGVPFVRRITINK